MIIPDVNLLLYAHIGAFAEHPRALEWWEHALNGDQEIGLTSISVFGFLRLATSRRVFESPMTVDFAAKAIESWLQCANARYLASGPLHLEIAFRLARSIGTAGNLTSDIQLAAYAIEYQGEIVSNDADFTRFPGLRWSNPLTKSK
jgi:toxin-antitoxin system PIN domain toxin